MRNTIVKQKEEEKEYYVNKKKNYKKIKNQKTWKIKNAKHEGRWHKVKKGTRKYRFALK